MWNINHSLNVIVLICYTFNVKKTLIILLFISLISPSFAFYTKPDVTDNKQNDSVLRPDLNHLSLKDSVINFGKIYLSLPYRYGGTTPRGFDCSGFTSHVFNNFGINLNRSSRDQASQLPSINKLDLKTGDLVFFEGQRHNGTVGHVGIVTETKPNGEFNFIHSSIKKGVTISSSEEQYYGSRFVKGGRVLDENSFIVNPKTQISLYQENKDKIKLNKQDTRSNPEIIDYKYHTVKKGETLSSISQDYDVPISTIQRLNGLKKKKIKKGQQLKISEGLFIPSEPTLAKSQSGESKIAETSSSNKINAQPGSVTVVAPTSSAQLPEPTLNPKTQNNIKLTDTGKPVKHSNTNLASTKTNSHKVNAGESLYAIAKNYNLTVNELKKLNNLSSENIKPGQILKVEETIEESPVNTDKTVISKRNHASSDSGPVILKVKKGDTLYSLSRQYGCTVKKIKEWNKNISENLNIGDKLIIYK